MDNQTKQFEVTAETAVAEGEKKTAATGLGKFKDVEALMQAYTNLEAEFTRRSQRLRQLESAIKEQSWPAQDEVKAQVEVEASDNVEAETDAYAEINSCAQSQGAVPSHGQPLQGQLLLDAAMSDEQVKNAVISEYLEKTAKNKGVQFITGGVNITAQRRVPSSVKEAGALAQQFLNNREI